MSYVMARIKFKTRVYKSGNSHVVTIPAKLINDKQLKANSKYEIIINTNSKK